MGKGAIHKVRTWAEARELANLLIEEGKSEPSMFDWGDNAELINEMEKDIILVECSLENSGISKEPICSGELICTAD